METEGHEGSDREATTITREHGMSVRRRRAARYKPRVGMHAVGTLPEAKLERLNELGALMEAELASHSPDEDWLEALSESVTAIDATTEDIAVAPLGTLGAGPRDVQLARYIFRARDGITVPHTDAHRSFLEFFREHFHVPVSSAWALYFVDEMHKAAVQNESALMRERVPTAASFPEVPDLREQARRILERTQSELASRAIPQRVPAAFDENLTMYFLARYGFNRGGGPSKKISRSALLHLLASPRKLITELLEAPDGATRWKATINELSKALR